MTALQMFLDSQAGAAILAMVGVAFADFATGSFAAIRDGTFELGALAAFLRKHIWGRVAPISTLLTLGYFSGGTISQLFMASALAAGAAYTAETASSILGNLSPPKSIDMGPDKNGFTTLSDPVNPVPTE